MSTAACMAMKLRKPKNRNYLIVGMSLFDAGKWENGWNAFFGYADGSNRQSRKKQVKPYECADVADEGYPDGLTANLAVKKLNELTAKNEPFCLAVGFFKPHLPFTSLKILGYV